MADAAQYSRHLFQHQRPNKNNPHNKINKFQGTMITKCLPSMIGIFGLSQIMQKQNVIIQMDQNYRHSISFLMANPAASRVLNGQFYPISATEMEVTTTTVAN